MPATPLPPVPDTRLALARWTATQWQAVIGAEPRAAAAWMLQAARLGDATAQTTLGQWLLDGHGQPRDATAARAWFLKVAWQAQPMGMNMAGRCLENGWGGAVDCAAAADWYRKAAQTGLEAAMYNLGNLLATGLGVARDPAAALDWYRQAAVRGYAKAKTKVGRFYEDGLVVPRDPDAAFVCYEAGAQGGDFRGQFNYAGMLAARGRLEEALHWLRQVPLTATPRYRREVGPLLLQSPHAAFRAVGQTLLEGLADSSPDS